eukprot:jgi/Botrbrau1/10597/Bobra.0358s0015.2
MRTTCSFLGTRKLNSVPSVQTLPEAYARLRYLNRFSCSMPGVPESFDSEAHSQRAWDHFRRLGAPKYHVAPMVDQSELAFRLLCRKHGAEAAYTPMLHSRLFLQDPKYRAEQFTTTPADRPLFAQFCANDPETLLGAARIIEGDCDYVDLNLGCPQHIAKRGRYGAFLMDDLPLVERLVRTLSSQLSTPVSCKIRIFPDLQQTLAYARMLEAAGCSLLAVHGRTRQQKDCRAVKADWDAIKAVRETLRIPVLANGNIRTLHDVHACMAYTGAAGVMSAESLLEDPALFSATRLQSWGERNHLSGCHLLLEYLQLAEEHTTPPRMIRGHAFKLLGDLLPCSCTTHTPTYPKKERHM